MKVVKTRGAKIHAIAFEGDETVKKTVDNPINFSKHATVE